MTSLWTWTVRIPVVLSGAAIIFHLLINCGIDRDAILHIDDTFPDGDSYMAYMETVEFPGISLTIHEIKRGDNYWKIARRYGVTIDTLIGANPHWKDLKARTKQRILVPGQRGVIHLVRDTTAWRTWPYSTV